MPNRQTIKRHGGIKNKRVRKIDANTYIIVFTYNDGRKYQETRRMVPVKQKQARVKGKKGTYFPR